ncbi:MAG TPA: type II CAAX endopeptidase family protein [Dehalococcoidia bacterium]|jgi:hypothetical protein
MDITANTPAPRDVEVFPGRRIAWGPKDVLAGILWFIGLFVVMPIPFGLALFYGFGDGSNGYFAGSLVLSMAAEAGIVLVAATYSFRKYGGSWDRLGFTEVNWRVAGWGAAAFAGALAFSFAYGALIQVFDVEALKSKCDDQLPKEILNNKGLIALAGVTIIGFAPLCEETFFRGFTFPGIASRWGVAAGIIASAFLFSAAHISLNLHKTFVPIFGIGLIFAFCYWRSGSLVSTILAHLAFNTISFTAIAASSCK